MRMKGRIPYVDSNNPDAWGRCDKTGLPVMYASLRPQMEYIGETLQWTGLMVNEKDLDDPNPQLIPPRLKPDPLPVRNPRYFYLAKQPGVPTGLALVGSPANTSLTVSWTPVVALPGTNIVAATNYAVFWSSSYGEEFSTLPLLSPQDMILPSYTIQGLMPGQMYSISVASLNDVGYTVVFKGTPAQKTTTHLSYTISSLCPPIFVTTLTL